MKVSTTLLVVAAVTVCAMFLLLQPVQGSPAPYEAGLRLEKLARAPSHARLLLHFALRHDHDENHAKLVTHTFNSSILDPKPHTCILVPFVSPPPSSPCPLVAARDV